MSLDFYLEEMRNVEVFDIGITHNMTRMAKEAGVYFLWDPARHGIQSAGEAVEKMQSAIRDMEARPDHYRQFNSPNGWGSYETFLPKLRQILEACQEFPNAKIRVSA